MTERTDSTGGRPGEGVDRRSLLTTFGATAATIMAAGAVATGASLGFSRPVHASTVTDVDILNFGLNLEYVEAEYYSRAFFGTGLMSGHARRRHARLRSGRLGVPFQTPQVASLAEKIVIDETNHVRFLRRSLAAWPWPAPTSTF